MECRVRVCFRRATSYEKPLFCVTVVHEQCIVGGKHLFATSFFPDTPAEQRWLAIYWPDFNKGGCAVTMRTTLSYQTPSPRSASSHTSSVTS